MAARDGSSRTTVAAAVPRVVLDFTWAVHHQRLGGEGQVRSARERRCCIARLLGGSLGTIGPGGTATETCDAASFLPLSPWVTGFNEGTAGTHQGAMSTTSSGHAAVQRAHEPFFRSKKAVAGSRPERTTPGGSSRAGRGRQYCKLRWLLS